jgi:formylglycine-generating enzyme required for sulfatase activity
LCVIKQFAFSNNHPETRQIALKLFYEEAQHLETLGKHDQIPELLAYFDVEGQPYLVQQFIDGQDLEQELATAGTFNQAKIRELLESLLPVLDFLHHQSPPVIHRDIKPANIIRRRSDGGLVLVDFGAAKQATQSMLAKPGTVIGSPEYMSSEQVRGKPVFASDIYSLGVTCIHLLTQVSPFDLFDTDRDDWVWRDYLVDNLVDEKLGKVLDKMIANFLSKRYKLAKDVLEEFNGVAINNPVSALPLPPSSKRVISNQSTNKNSRLEFFEFEAVHAVTVRKTIKKKISLRERIILKRWLSNKIDETVNIVEAQRKKCKSQQIVEDLGSNVKLEMVYIPAGSFMMGRRFTGEKPIHDVTIEPFYMSKFVITQKQYEAIMGINPSQFKGIDRPVESVSWHDAMKFCEKLSQHTGEKYTLPSESQWEYSCRANTNTNYYFGNNRFTNLHLKLMNDINPMFIPPAFIIIETTDVGIFPPNIFGLYDMHGNVEEWCLDTWHGNYNGAPVDGSAWIENNNNSHVLRGFYHSQSRCEGIHSYSKSLCGFRVVCASSTKDNLEYTQMKLNSILN